MVEEQSSSRRDFLARSTKTAAIAGLATLGSCAAEQAGGKLRVVQGPKPKMTGKVINVGMIGAGGRATYLMSQLLKQKEIEVDVKAVADPYKPHLERTVQNIKDATGKAPDAYEGADDWKDKIMGREDIHALLIAVPCHLHAEMYLAAFAAGKHYYGEKPMCVTVKEADALVAAQQRNPHTVAWIGFQRRACRKYQEGIQHLRDGVIGETIAGYGAWNNAWGPLGLPGEGTQIWFGRRKFSGDWMLEQACHTWDVFNWVANALPESASGAGHTGLFKDVDPERDVTDIYNSIIKYPGGFILDFEHNWLMPKTEQEGIFSGIFERVMGPKGGLDLSAGKYYPRESGEIMNFKYDNNPDQDALLSFLRATREGTPAVSGVENGRMATLTGLLVRKAVYEERWVTMKEILAEG
ncbi:MAG: Gfo/Idh/MocA family oxidoreductase [Phycisphaerales bacterium]|nr:Gfo/Idh/MocA family oxidoreductase [Phycisphaerales bacterium]